MKSARGTFGVILFIMVSLVGITSETPIAANHVLSDAAAAAVPPTSRLWRCTSNAVRNGDSSAYSVKWWGVSLTVDSLLPGSDDAAYEGASLSSGSKYWVGTVATTGPLSDTLVGPVCLVLFPKAKQPVAFVYTVGEGVTCCAGFQVLVPGAKNTIRTIHEPRNWIGDVGSLKDADGAAVIVGADFSVKDPFYAPLDNENYPTRVAVIRGGRFVDVTSSYKWLVAATARNLWRSALRYSGGWADPRSVLLGFVGDECEAGVAQTTWPAVARWASNPGRVKRFGESAAKTLSALLGALRTAGYCRNVDLPV